MRIRRVVERIKFIRGSKIDANSVFWQVAWQSHETAMTVMGKWCVLYDGLGHRLRRHHFTVLFQLDMGEKHFTAVTLFIGT